MDISSYREKHGLSQAEFAAMFPKEQGLSASQGLVWQWESGKTKVTAERAIQIERITAAEVSRHDLRPDIFGPPAANDDSPAPSKKKAKRSREAANAA